MTDKETEIKALAGTIFYLKQALANIGMMNANKSYEERKKAQEEYGWNKYRIFIEEKKLEAPSI